jgi:hypothetical protein
MHVATQSEVSTGLPMLPKLTVSHRHKRDIGIGKCNGQLAELLAVTHEDFMS